MTRRCFFVPEVASQKRIFDLPAPLARQLGSVLRARVGESIELLDGQGAAWECLITGIARGRVSVSLVGKLDRPARESPLVITLGVGLARSDTMDLIVRQATEMGVFRLAVFRAARSQYGLSAKLSEKKRERWLKIASEAMCQCGRARFPEIEIFDNLGHFLNSFETEESPGGPALKIFALEREECSDPWSLRKEAAADIHRVLAVIGPEGGWDKLERSTFVDAGFKPVSLGPRTLRLETAAVALISSIQLLWGDMGSGLVYGSRQNDHARKE